MISLIPAANPGPLTGPAGNNTWLVDGAEPLLVDAGVGEASHLDAVARALGGRPLARVFVTHAHRDHSAGVPRLKARWPGIDVIGGPDGAAPRDGGTIAAGDGTLRMIATPGHSPDHFCLWDPDHRALFAGDLLAAGGTIMIVASAGGDLREYLASLARVRDLEPARVYPGHGAIVDRPVELIDRYIAHRHDRERQVLAALEAGPLSIDKLVAQVYPGLAAALRGAAAETMLAHLRKLEADGRAAERGHLWSLR